MTEYTRRAFVKTSAGAAAGATVIGALATETAQAHSAGATQPVLAYVKDPRRGEVAIIVGDGEKTIRDPSLTARIVAAAR